MLFYRIKAELLREVTESDNRGSRYEQAAEMQVKAETFLMGREKSCQISISNVMHRKKTVVLCAAIKKDSLSDSTALAFIKAVDLEVGQIDINEITLEIYSKMLQQSCQNGFIENDDNVCEELGIAELTRYHGRRNISFSETIISEAATKRELYREAGRLLCDDSLIAELGRIYQGMPEKAVMGHPVHYLVQANDRETTGEILRILLTALYQNGRTKSRRYVEVSISSDERLPEGLLRILYEACAGGVVVVSLAEPDGDDSEYAKPDIEIMAKLCGVMRQHRNDVLTVFCLRRKSEKLKNMLLENLGAVTVVPIAQETVFGDRAKGYLRSRAKEHSVSPDKSLYKGICPEKGFSAGELNLMFDEWYDKRLKSKIYAQYADLDAANRQIAARKPRGSAIEELTQMIGLSDAKDIIRQALDFYKAQKLFKEKGFSSERPAMHMVFTGNPGTAKTTVARLFAQIMKDNGLLPEGKLYEVGRADLVGRYVGWTAQIVKSKFKEAKGSVLFIDEAYSLVDDKDGLYGDEAINTIVQEMENCREEMVVIFAGYPDKMEGFLRKNPGLRSRIAFHVPFADYDADELYQITEMLAEKKGVALDAGVREKLEPIIDSAMKSGDFGNGRFARNLLEKAIMKQASRLVAMDVDVVTQTDIGTLLPEDFEATTQTKKEPLKIGFVG